ncbi:hypothetical protein LCGC14_0795850 [marine sediment metagenome]|uniref:Uncharacterized protein n=1 Tax=marine sediment metagenome TaxID=412755 RepID=A0A0F9SB56_9ZZZZ
MARVKREPPLNKRFCVNIPAKWLRFMRCFIETDAFESVSAGVREMMEFWFVDTFGHEFEKVLTEKFRDIKETPKANITGRRAYNYDNL